MRISVIGAGVQGSAIALILTRVREVDEILCSDSNFGRARRVAEILRSDKVRAERADAGEPRDLKRVLEGADAVINATPPAFSLKLMDAALRAGVHYVDLASDDPIEALGMSDRWAEAGLTAVIAQGGPFVMNALVRRAADMLDRVEEIRIRCGWVKPEQPDRFPTWSPAWCPEEALAEWEREPLVFEDGNFKRVPTFSGIEERDFPEPVGRLTLCLVDYEPTYTLPRFIDKGVRRVDCKIPPDWTAGALIRMGLASDEPIEVCGARIAPRDLLLALVPHPADFYHSLLFVDPSEFSAESAADLNVVACYLAEIEGERAGERYLHTAYRISNFLENLKRYGTPWADVAIPAVVTALMLTKGEVKRRGVIPPEGLDPDPFLARLASWGITFHESSRKIP